MKLNKIISSALVLVMLLTSIMTVLPITAMATDYVSAVKVTMGDVDESKNDKDALKNLGDKYLQSKYSTAAEMLADELKTGALDCISANGYNLYVNRYSGFVFYENTKTGQILTSNPVDPYYSGSKLSTAIMSQVEIEYTDVSNPSVEGSGTYDSLSQLQQGFPLKLTEIARDDGARGISVQYTLGVNSADFRVPAYILSEDFVDHIIKPGFDRLAEIMTEYCGDGTIDYNINNNETIFNGTQFIKKNVIEAVNKLDEYAQKVLGVQSDKYRDLANYIESARILFNNYNFINPATIDRDLNGVLFEIVPVLNEGKTVYRMVDENLVTYRLVNSAIATLLGSLYTKENSAEDLDKTGYKAQLVNSASFLVSINYYLDRNGELSYEVPMSAPYFVNNNPTYTVKAITPLKYFGAGDMTTDGYIFFPDGSGSVIEFSNIRTIQPNYKVSVFGNDYGYATLTSSNAHLEATTMPVFGMVNEVKANAVTADRTGEATVTNGFFSIIEDGASLTNLVFSSGGSNHKYAMTYASYTPQPMDVCDLSETISVSGIGFYYVVSESVYDGSYCTRVTMLTDEKAAATTGTYAPSYIGMAERYRDYLENEGVISKLTAEETKKDIPLYIEVLGAMDVTQKILSVPVVVSTPLTTFKDVETMYSELSGSGINNINFRLTGFANGGMASTYPVKVKWEDSLGGEGAARDLVSAAEKSGFGLYPEFDFMYIHNQELFDGINYLDTTAIMVDNRYASKQSFNAVVQLYESMFSLVISSDSYAELYTKFNKEYSKYGFDGISVSTLGSELNSNFDEKNAIHREDSLAAVKKLFERMSDEYSVMTDVGNVYAVKYADHILGAPTDSSHYKYSSYTVPFYGMVLHGYVNYAASPINYSGFPDYDILRSIENGAYLQYILCYENTNYLKDDPLLSKYYGVDYKNWKDTIVKQYNILKNAIGDLQTNIITDHTTLIGERIIERAEVIENFVHLITEYMEAAASQFEAKIAYTAETLREADMFSDYKGLHADIDEASVVAAIIATLNLDINEAKKEKITASEAAEIGVQTEEETTLYDVIASKVSAFAVELTNSYPAAEKAYSIELSASDVNYSSQYKYNTASLATDKNYETTDYTCNNKNIVMVTYLDETTGKTTIFFINYNVYDVKIKLDSSIHAGIEGKLDDSGYITLEASSFVKIQ